jgi:hypothetical protein
MSEIVGFGDGATGGAMVAEWQWAEGARHVVAILHGWRPGFVGKSRKRRDWVGFSGGGRLVFWVVFLLERRTGNRAVELRATDRIVRPTWVGAS